MTEQFDVIVVGAGMTGASLALGLAAQGFRVAVVERKGLPCPDSSAPPSSVVALNQASQALLQRQQCWPQQCTPYYGMRVWDQDSVGNIDFADQGEPLGHIVGSQALQHLQQQQLLQRPIQVFDRSRVEHWQPQQLDLDSGERLSAPLIVAADGKRSQLRQWAGIDVNEHDYQQEALTALVRCHQPHQQHCHQAFTEQGPIALLPVDNDRLAALVWSQDLGLGRKYLPLAEQQRQLQTAFGQSLGQLELLSDCQVAPLVALHAKSYHRQGVLLVGDAAHSIHPLAGQGVNLGFADVHCLIVLLTAAKAAGCPLNSPALLDRYQRQRQADNSVMLHAMGGFKWLFGQHNPYWRSLRASGLNWVNQQPLLKSFIVQRARNGS